MDLGTSRAQQKDGKGQVSLPRACNQEKAWKTQVTCGILTLGQFNPLEPAAKTNRHTGLSAQARSQGLFANH